MRGILIACSDNLARMSKAIPAVYPKTEHQLCIVHLRNILAYVAYKDRSQVVADLKPIYTAATERSSPAGFGSWITVYTHIAKSWYTNWPNLVIFLNYPAEIRKIIYTTNPLE